MINDTMWLVSAVYNNNEIMKQPLQAFDSLPNAREFIKVELRKAEKFAMPVRFTCDIIKKGD